MNIKTLCATLTVASILFTSSAIASGIDVGHAWARASAGPATSGGAYLTLHNPNEHDHTLLSVASDVAKRVELHTHTMSDGMMKMRKLDGGILIPAGQTVMLQPGGYHVMLMGLHAPLIEGSSFPLTLSFDNGKDVTLTVKVRTATAMDSGMSPCPDHAMGHGMDQGMDQGMDHVADHGADHGADHVADHGADHGVSDGKAKDTVTHAHSH